MLPLLPPGPLHLHGRRHVHGHTRRATPARHTAHGILHTDAPAHTHTWTHAPHTDAHVHAWTGACARPPLPSGARPSVPGPSPRAPPPPDAPGPSPAPSSVPPRVRLPCHTRRAPVTPPAAPRHVPRASDVVKAHRAPTVPLGPALGPLCARAPARCSPAMLAPAAAWASAPAVPGHLLPAPWSTSSCASLLRVHLCLMCRVSV